jgi:hypothetical protein
MEMTRSKCTGFIVLLFLTITLLGCAGYKHLSIKMSMATCDRSPERVFAYEKGQYCVIWIKGSDLSGVYIKGSVASVPEDVVIYGLKTFFGYTGEEGEFKKIVSAVVKGIELQGRVFIYAFTPKSMYVAITYSEEQNHMIFQDLGKAGQKVVGAIDLSAVDVSIRPGKASGQGGGMGNELRELKKLRDEGVITEEEFQEQKRKVLDKY